MSDEDTLQVADDQLTITSDQAVEQQQISYYGSGSAPALQAQATVAADHARLAHDQAVLALGQQRLSALH